MRFSSCIIIYICIELGLSASVPATRERHDLTISECAAKGGECDETRGRPVCGTDDQTYPSRCHLLRVQCSGHQVSLKYRGPCKACKEARDYALKHKSRNPPKFIPRCKTDGTYAAIQCLGDTGCWCSDITGKPIENTSVRNGKPKCREYNKANIRRSPARHLSPNRGRRICSAADRAAFNANLIKVFHSEFMRAGQQKRGGTTGGAGGAGAVDAVGAGAGAMHLPPSDKSVLDWKFTYLDANANQMLDKNEFRELKKLVKRAVKPRRCGRAFGKFCDLDDDDRLTLTEWNNCFSKDEINRHSAAERKNSVAAPTSFHGYAQHNNKNSNSNNNNNNNNNNDNSNSNRQVSPLYNNHAQVHSNSHQNQNTHHSNSYNNNNNKNNDNLNNINQHSSTLDELDSESNAEDEESSQHLDYDEDDYDPDEADDSDTLSMLNTFGSSTNYPSIYFLRPRPESPLKESEGESDCLADQAATLEEQRHGGTIFYVPECTADGRYQRVQCYRSTPYCWCVHEDSGKNIPGTSVKDKRPQCDAIYTAPRPMKGCPEPRKTVFLNDLKEYLKTHILASTSAGSNTTKWSSEDERIATLSFVLLDKNKNKSWERKEWKTFREMVTNSKTLRKCGKKMPRYCDVNSDKKITLTEWLNCLQVQRTEVQPTSQSPTEANESVTSKSLKLTGSNPLEQYLKD